MEINLERIKNRFDNKLTYSEITEIGNQYKKIHSIIPFKIGLEETIIKHFKFVFNKKICNENIMKLQTEIRGYDNDLMLLSRDGFDLLRQRGNLLQFLSKLDDNQINSLVYMNCIRGEEGSEIKLQRFRSKRDEVSRNYNKMDFGNVGEWKV